MWRRLLRHPARSVSLILGVAITATMILVSGLDLTVANRARNTIHDAYLTAAPRTYDPQAPVHIIDVDEASLDLYGQWPWPRPYLAVLAEKLFEHGAVVIGFDILFAEADRTASTTTRVPAPFSGAALNPPLPPSNTHDLRFAESLRAGPTVLAIAGTQSGRSPEIKAGISYTGSDPSAVLTRYPSALTNLDVFTEAATGLGSVSLGQLDDGIVRSLPAVTDFGGVLVPAFALELLRVAQGAGGYILRTTEASGEISGGLPRTVEIRVGALDIPLDGKGHVRLNYAGDRPERITSAADVLTANGIDPDLEQAVAGRIVLVGSSAQSLFDIRATPFGREVPGVVIHAELIEQIAAGSYINRPDWARGAEVLAIVITGLMLTLALLSERPVLGLALTFILSTLAVVGGSALFATNGLLLDPIFPALTAFLVFLPGASLGIILKERARARVRAQFAYFVPSEIVDEIADDPLATLTPTGADRELTVLFADMRSFTTLTENMPPDDVVRYVNTFLSTVGDTLVASGATIDKFMGDAIMAFWNAPIETPNHREMALQSILQIETAIRNLQKDLPVAGLPPIDVAIGLNTGMASIGLMGTKDRLSYTCIGDSVTLAARLETLTRRYNVGNCVSYATLPDDMVNMIAIELDLIAVKGRARAEPVLTIVPRSEHSEGLQAAIKAARTDYLARDWDAAEAAFQALRQETLQGRTLEVFAHEFLERIAGFRAAPPPQSWDGSAIAKTK